MVNQMKSFLVHTILVINLAFLCVVELQAYKDIPPNFPRCHRLDPNLNECLLKATETVKPFLIEGVPDFNFPPLENINITEVRLKQGTDSLNFDARLTNIRIHGLSNYKFSKYDYDVPKGYFTCVATISPLSLDGGFTAIGRLLLSPIEGKGTFTAGIESITVLINQKIKLVKRKDGEKYVQPEYTKTKINASGPKAHIEGLFSGSQEVNDLVNRVIAENADVLFEDLKPVVEKVVSTLIEDLIFSVIEDKVPYRILYESAVVPKT